MDTGGPRRSRRNRHWLWGASLAFLAASGRAEAPLWPDAPPIPVPKPVVRLMLAAPEMLRLEFLPLVSPEASATTETRATVVLERASAPAAEVAPYAADLPVPVPKPALASATALAPAAVAAAAESDGVGSDAIRVEPLLPYTIGKSLASIEASAAAGSPLDSSPFAPPPVTSSLSVNVASNALHFQLPSAGNLTIMPSLALLGLPAADPNLVRMSAPHDPRLTPTPGIDAVMQFGDMTLDAKLNQPLRTVETKLTPDTRTLPDRSNFGVDMKFKF